MDTLSKILTLLFGLIAMLTSLWAVLARRTDLFRTALVKNQLEEMGHMRTSLSKIIFDIDCVSQIDAQLQIFEWSLSDYQRNCPDEWSQYTRYRENSLDIFYKIMPPKYHLFPKLVKQEKINALYSSMMSFQPFTTAVTSKKSFEEISQYQNDLLKFIHHIDEVLVNYG